MMMNLQNLLTEFTGTTDDDEKTKNKKKKTIGDIAHEYAKRRRPEVSFEGKSPRRKLEGERNSYIYIYIMYLLFSMAYLTHFLPVFVSFLSTLLFFLCI